MGRLAGRTVAIVVSTGFEALELTRPKEAIEREGGCAVIVSPQHGRVRSWDRTNWGAEFPVDRDIAEATPDDYDGLVVPGGVMSPDHLRMDPTVVKFVKAFFEADKPVAAICHGPWVFIDAGVVTDRELTSYRSLKRDLQNAGARWVDREVVVDGSLVTSRNLNDLDAFCGKLVEVFAHGAPVLGG